MKEERFLHPGNLQQLGDQLRNGTSKKSTAVSLRQANRETSIEDPGHLPAPPSPRNKSATVCRGWVLKLGFQRTDLRRALGLAIQREPEKAGMWSKQQLGCTQEGACVCH